jgi:hypothetical protein
MGCLRGVRLLLLVLASPALATACAPLAKRPPGAPPYDGFAAALAFSPDGSRLAAGLAKGNSVVVYAMPGLHEVKRLTGATEETMETGALAVRALAFSPDSTFLATAGGSAVELFGSGSGPAEPPPE